MLRMMSIDDNEDLTIDVDNEDKEIEATTDALPAGINDDNLV